MTILSFASFLLSAIVIQETIGTDVTNTANFANHGLSCNCARANYAYDPNYGLYGASYETTPKNPFLVTNTNAHTGLPSIGANNIYGAQSYVATNPYHVIANGGHEMSNDIKYGQAFTGNVVNTGYGVHNTRQLGFSTENHGLRYYLLTNNINSANEIANNGFAQETRLDSSNTDLLNQGVRYYLLPNPVKPACAYSHSANGLANVGYTPIYSAVNAVSNTGYGTQNTRNHGSINPAVLNQEARPLTNAFRSGHGHSNTENGVKNPTNQEHINAQSLSQGLRYYYVPPNIANGITNNDYTRHFESVIAVPTNQAIRYASNIVSSANVPTNTLNIATPSSGTQNPNPKNYGYINAEALNQGLRYPLTSSVSSGYGSVNGPRNTGYSILPSGQTAPSIVNTGAYKAPHTASATSNHAHDAYNAQNIGNWAPYYGQVNPV